MRSRLCDIFITLSVAGLMYSGCLGDEALAQNPTCPTRPLGDSTNACSSTAFVQNQLAAGTGTLVVGTTPITGGTSTRVLYDNAGVLGEYTNVQLTALCQSFTSVLSGCAPASGGGTTNFLRADGTWAPAGSSTLTSTHIFVGNGSNIATDFGTLATFASAGGLTLAPTSGNGLTINPASTTGLALVTTQTGPSTGASSSSFPYNTITVTNGANTGAGGVATALFVNLTTNNANAAGNVWGVRIDTNYTVGSTLNGDFIAITPRSISSAANAGSGGVYGANPQGILLSGGTLNATNGEVAGAECDARIDVGASAAWQFGCAAVKTGAQSGGLLDAAFEIGAVSKGWLAGIVLNKSHGAQSIDTTGSVILDDGNAQTISCFACLPNITFTTIFNLKAFSAVPGTLTLGAVGTTGTIALKGTTSGTATITPQATAGTPTLTIGTTSGTIAGSATSPLVISATTGIITCSTCATTTNGGALSGTAPVAISAAGAISITGATGQVLAGAGPAFTATPQLGVASTTTGSLAFATSGGAGIGTLNYTGGAGSATISLPATTTVLAGLAVVQTFTVAQAISSTTSPQFTVSSTGANNAYILINNGTAGNQSGFQLNDGGTAKWQFIKQTGNTFLVFSNADGVTYQTFTPAGGISFTPVTGTSFGGAADPGVNNIAVNGTITIVGLATDATHTDRSVCQDTTSKILFFGSGAAGICLGTSSSRFKHDIIPLDPGLDQITKLKPVAYRLNEDRGDPNKVLYGFTAEQGREVLPELAGLGADGQPQTFDYIGVVPVLVHAVQQLKADNDNLREQIRAIGGR